MNNNTDAEKSPVWEQGDCFGIGRRSGMPECRCPPMHTPCSTNILYTPLPLSKDTPFIPYDVIAVFRRLSYLRYIRDQNGDLRVAKIMEKRI
jgi:hypothetical protein